MKILTNLLRQLMRAGVNHFHGCRPSRHRRFFLPEQRGRHSGRVVSAHVKGKTIALSFITVGELYVWTVKRNWSPKRIAALEQRLKAAVIVPYDLELCKEYGRVKAGLLTTGRVVPANDLWIAVCALRHSIPLVTHNAKDFDGIPGLRVISESTRPLPPKTRNLFNGGTGQS
jgi:tRNA(fMet)-specific endonuclease VapC